MFVGVRDKIPACSRCTCTEANLSACPLAAQSSTTLHAERYVETRHDLTVPYSTTASIPLVVQRRLRFPQLYRQQYLVTKPLFILSTRREKYVFFPAKGHTCHDAKHSDRNSGISVAGAKTYTHLLRTCQVRPACSEINTLFFSPPATGLSTAFINCRACIILQAREGRPWLPSESKQKDVG
jgi:hypothetical protein